MRRDPFNLCFLILLITVLALQHSVAFFGPGLHGETLPHVYLTGGDALRFGEEFASRLHRLSPVHRAAAFFDQAWHRSIAFEEWWLDYTASQWELFNVLSPAESDVLQARFHVANAEVLTDGLNENARAVKELARAETSLDAARSIAGRNIGPQFSAVSEEIATAEAHEQTRDAVSTLPFEAIKADLDHLIALLRLSTT
jgi:hypothetical protein